MAYNNFLEQSFETFCSDVKDFTIKAFLEVGESAEIEFKKNNLYFEVDIITADYTEYSYRVFPNERFFMVGTVAPFGVCAIDDFTWKDNLQINISNAQRVAKLIIDSTFN